MVKMSFVLCILVVVLKEKWENQKKEITPKTILKIHYLVFPQEMKMASTYVHEKMFTLTTNKRKWSLK